MGALKSIVLAMTLAKKKRDVLVAQLNRCKHAQANAQNQMLQLSSYAEETHEKWVVTSQVGFSPEIMRHQYQFMARLQEAIALQQPVLDRTEADVQRAHQNFLEFELKIASLEHMQKRLHSNMAAINNRHEQKQTDEFAATKKVTVFDTV
jgi:flagellar FliJ protein